MFNSATTCTQYYDMPSYVEKINTSCVSSNATYIDPDKYYNFILINKVYDDRQYIYMIYMLIINILEKKNLKLKKK